MSSDDPTYIQPEKKVSNSSERHTSLETALRSLGVELPPTLSDIVLKDDRSPKNKRFPTRSGRHRYSSMAHPHATRRSSRAYHHDVVRNEKIKQATLHEGLDFERANKFSGVGTHFDTLRSPENLPRHLDTDLGAQEVLEK